MGAAARAYIRAFYGDDPDVTLRLNLFSRGVLDEAFLVCHVLIDCFGCIDGLVGQMLHVVELVLSDGFHIDIYGDDFISQVKALVDGSVFTVKDAGEDMFS